MEDNLNGRRPQWKMTSIEDKINLEDDLNGRQPQYIIMSNVTRL